MEENQAVAPALALVNSVLSAQQSLDPVNIAPSVPALGVGSGNQSICLNLQSLSSSAGAGKLENGSAVLYPDTAQGTDTLLRATPLGAQLIQLLRDSAAPTSTTWNLTIPPGDQIKPLDDGSLAIIDPTLPTISSGAVPAGSLDPQPTSDGTVPASTVAPVDPGDTADPLTATDLAATPPDDSLEQDPTATEAQYQNEDFERQSIDRDTDGQAIGFVMPPSARDATGKPVPMTLSTDGSSTITSAADTSAGGYSYPITTYNTAIKSNGSKGNNGAQFGFGDPSANTFASPLWKGFRASSKFGRTGLQYFRAGVNPVWCDQYDGVTGPVVVDGSGNPDLSQINDSNPNAQHCKQAATVVKKALGAKPRWKVILALQDDCNDNTDSTNPCLAQALPPNCVRPTLDRALSHYYPHRAPYPDYWKRFRCSLLALLNTPPFDQVTRFDAYNEPDVAVSHKPFGAALIKDPRNQPPKDVQGSLAADEWKLVNKLATMPSTRPRKCAAHPTCTFAAGDFALYQSTFSQKYIAELREVPPVFAFHPYGDVIGTNNDTDFNHRYLRKAAQAHKLLIDLAQAAAKAKKHYPDVWLDESGVALQQYGGVTRLSADPCPNPAQPTDSCPQTPKSPVPSGQAVAAQQAAVKRFGNLPNLDLKPSETPGRKSAWKPIKLVIYYDWSASADETKPPSSTAFDSGLLNNQGNPRPAYCYFVPNSAGGCTRDGL